MRGQFDSVPVDPFDPRLREYLIASMGSLADETLRILFLGGNRRLIADEQMQSGSRAQLTLYPRTIFRRALELEASALILVHNHPSGDPNPSAEDVRATQKLDELGRALGIEIVDHIIVTSAYIHHIVRKDAAVPFGCGRSGFTLRSPDASDPIALANAKATLRRKLLRQQLLGYPELFGDPGWEMIVDVFIHELERKQLPVTSLCVTAGIPMSSALRLAQRLVDAELLIRVPDPYDGRRSFVKLGPGIAQRLRAYFGEGGD